MESWTAQNLVLWLDRKLRQLDIPQSELVVEYKGALTASGAFDDINETRAVGRLWEQHSDGKGLFLVVEKHVGGRGMREQLAEKIGG
jgi:hypothetical protein